MFAGTADAPLTYAGLISLVLLFLSLAGVVASIGSKLADLRERIARLEEHIQGHDRYHAKREEDL